MLSWFLKNAKLLKPESVWVVYRLPNYNWILRMSKNLNTFFSCLMCGSLTMCCSDVFILLLTLINTWVDVDGGHISVHVHVLFSITAVNWGFLTCVCLQVSEWRWSPETAAVWSGCRRSCPPPPGTTSPLWWGMWVSGPASGTGSRNSAPGSRLAGVTGVKISLRQKRKWKLLMC